MSILNEFVWRWKLAYRRLPLAIRSLVRVLCVVLAMLTLCAVIGCLIAYSVKAFLVAVGVVFFIFVWRIVYEGMM